MILPEVFQRVNWVDVLTVILLLRTCYIGARTGLSVEIFRIIGVILGLYVAAKYYSPFGSRINAGLSLPQDLVDGFSFVLLVLLPMLSLKLVALGLTKIVKLSFADKIDKWGGFLAGLLRGALLLSLLFMLFNILNVDYLVRSVDERSLSGPYIRQLVPYAYKVVGKTSPEDKLK
ncbi:MAG: CvpA family protein [Candidatus Omnitrophota bacterium]